MSQTCYRAFAQRGRLHFVRNFWPKVCTPFSPTVRQKYLSKSGLKAMCANIPEIPQQCAKSSLQRPPHAESAHMPPRFRSLQPLLQPPRATPAYVMLGFGSDKPPLAAPFAASPGPPCPHDARFRFWRPPLAPLPPPRILQWASRGWAAGGPWGSINSIGLIGRPNYPTFGDRPDQQRLHMVFVKILLAQGRGDLKELSAPP